MKDLLFKKMVVPPVGIIIEKRYKVIYINTGQIRFTASLLPGIEYPKIDDNIMWKGRIFKVSYVNNKKNRFSAIFNKFAENPNKINNTENVAELI